MGKYIGDVENMSAGYVPDQLAIKRQLEATAQRFSAQHASEMSKWSIPEAQPEKRKPMNPDAYWNQQMVEAQIRADSAYRTQGMEAPRQLYGETLENYRRRLLSGVISLSKKWGKISLTGLPDSALPAVEQDVYADAIEAGTRSGPGTGPLREVKENDRSGRTISRFYGDPEGCWAPFKLEPRCVTNIK